MPNVVNGKILLGWMGRNEALKTLLEEAVFDKPLSEEQAVRLWETHKAKVATLGNRRVLQPRTVPPNFKEKRAIERIIKETRARGGRNVRGLLKIDPTELVVHQLTVIEERAEFYKASLKSPIEMVKTILPPFPASRQLPTHHMLNKTIIQLPHSEFEVTVGRQGKLEISEQAQHVAVTALEDRILLWAGYHRTYALMLASQEYPEEIERVLPVVLTTDAEPFLGEASPFPDKRDAVRGPCPALFRDFFDADLCMAISLRKRRCQIEIDLTQARKVWVDD